MKFHKYGPVEIAIVEEDDGEPVIHGKFEGVEYTDHATWWKVVGKDEWVGSEDGDNRSAHIARMLDAGAVLCWHEYEAFRAADRAMGDATP